MTLVELLVSVMIIGMIATVLSAALTVTFRQHADTHGRLDVARWEQSLALWIPSDLASASTVDADASTVPCASEACTFGSNALQLSWDDGAGTTTVSYRYGPSAAGDSFVLTRVECRAGSCSSRPVLRDLAPPADDLGNPIPWTAGDEVPDTVIDVTVPLDVMATGLGAGTDNDTRAQRVIVNVNGMPAADGVDRSSTVSFTAGGSSLGSLEPTTFEGPTFLQANSGCGGPVTLIVDDSGSIGSNIDQVHTGVRSFVDAFEGTPTLLQIIRFDTTASTLGTTGWNRYFDLAEPSEVDELRGLVTSFTAGGYTNWEQAIFRTFYAENGLTYQQLGNPAVPTPELVVFFTDGVPTTDRIAQNSGDMAVGASDPPPARFDDADNGGQFSPRSWYRTDFLVDQFRDIRMIGVGIGNAFETTTRVDRSLNWRRRTVPNEVFLGDLVAGGDPSQHGSGASGNYVTRRYSPNDGWGDVSSADLLVTSDFSQFGGALTEIALAECGGTLTVQTRDGSGTPADAEITYQVGAEVVTTTRILKSGTFDVPLVGVASAEVELVPQAFTGTGYTPVAWSCRAGGADLVEGADYSTITPGDPGGGIAVLVRASAAVSCTLEVTR